MLTKSYFGCIVCITVNNTKHTQHINITKEESKMPDIKEMLPFLIPLIIAEIILLTVTLRHIFTHKNYKRGNRTLWVIVAIIGMEFIGPVIYFLLGKEDA